MPIKPSTDRRGWAWDEENALLRAEASDEATDVTLELRSKGAAWVYARSTLTDGLGGRFAFPMRSITQITTAGAATYTAAQFLEGIIDRDPNGAARTDTTPTAANLVADMPNAYVGASYWLIISNAGAATEDLTISAGTGVTLDGTIVIGDGKAQLYLVRFTNVTAASEAVTMYGLGDAA